MGEYGGVVLEFHKFLKKSIKYGWGGDCGGYTVGIVGPYGGAVRGGVRNVKSLPDINPEINPKKLVTTRYRFATYKFSQVKTVIRS